MTLKSIVYGGTDGIVTVFNIISTTIGIRLSVPKTIIMALTVLVADAISMAAADFLSSSAANKEDKLNDTDPRFQNPVKNAITTFFSFIIFGIIPVLLFIGLNRYFKQNVYKLLVVCMTVAFSLLGFLQSQFTGEVWYLSSARTSGYGIATSLLAYFVSNKLSQ